MHKTDSDRGGYYRETNRTPAFQARKENRENRLRNRRK
jgi:hypothetical protein